jgi:hypothetical protein
VLICECANGLGFKILDRGIEGSWEEKEDRQPK